MKTFRAAVLVAPLLWLTAFASAAQDVTLTSRDGSVEISGMLLSYDGEFYRIRSDFGDLTLDGSGVLCEGPGCPDLTAYVADVMFSGAPSMAEVLMPALIEAFAVRNGFLLERFDGIATDGPQGFRYELSERGSGRLAARFRFRLTDSAEGFADLLTEEADIVLSLREATPAEAERAREAGVGDLNLARHARIVGLDGLVPLAAVSNRIDRIAMDDLMLAFAGEITSWAHFGGPDEPITLHLPTAAMGAGRAFVEGLMTSEGLEPGGDVQRHATAAALAAAVAGDPFALGLGLLSEVGNARPLALVGPCGAQAVAMPRSLKTEDYPLTAPMFLYTPARRLPKTARDFLAFVTTPAAQPVVRRAGFVDQFPEGVEFDQQGLRLATAILAAGDEVTLPQLQRMVDRLMSKRRLTVTFRFEGGSSALDAQSRSNVALLAEALERGVFDDRRLVFVGFSDGRGPAATNLRLARARASAVRDAVALAAATADSGRVTLEIDAFGEAMPMACDEVAWGRKINRRVEVWLQ